MSDADLHQPQAASRLPGSPTWLQQQVTGVAKLAVAPSSVLEVVSRDGRMPVAAELSRPRRITHDGASGGRR